MKLTSFAVRTAADVLAVWATGGAVAQADSAMAIAQSTQTPMIEVDLPYPGPGATFTQCFPENLKPGHAWLALWPVGGGYTGLYGWFGKAGTPESIELYINDNWAGQPPDMGDCIRLGQIDVDGGSYEIWTRPRKGNRFAQFWSNRTAQRTSGEISYAQHFAAWRKLGLPNATLTRLTFAFEVRWGVPGAGTAHYKSFSIDPPVRR